MNWQTASNVLTFGGLYLSAVLMALEQTVKGSSDMATALPFLTKAFWSYAPLLLLSMVFLLWLRQRLRPFVHQSHASYVSDSRPRLTRPDWLPKLFRLHPQDITQRLYVGRVSIGIDHLSDDRCVEVGFVCFNGAEQLLNVTSASGYIAYTIPTEAVPERLPPPVFKETSSRTADPTSEFTIVLEQRIPARIVQKFAAALAGSPGITFEFGSLNIMMHPPGSPDAFIRLPMWDGVSVRQVPSAMTVGRHIRLSTSAVAVGKSSLGPAS